ncbi:MAG: purine-nucleoside phosphorylase [Beijerinckiaceae bacterium]
MNDDIQPAIALLAQNGITGPIDAAIILGTGLGGLADDVEHAIRIPFADIPGFPISAVSGHAGTLIAGWIAGARVVLLQGRVHYYEHGDPRAMRIPVGVLAALQPRVLLLTNAAGSLHDAVGPGALVSISDHINYSGLNPLIGESGDRRFVPMTDAYDAAMRQTMQRAARNTGVVLHDGVYMWFSGPSFETPAEIRMAQHMGADLVGMSTVPEVILARYFGLRVAALSLVTNLGAGIQGTNPTHGETKDVGAHAAPVVKALVRAFLKEVRHD